MSNVSLKKVCKSYDNKKSIINNIDLEIADKEFIVLVGASGCGKSTILRMIAGLEEITSGEILIDNRVVNNVHPKDRDIAFVFQSYALYPHMSVYDNIAFGLKMRKVDKKIIDEKVKEAAKVLDLTQYLDRKPKQLSGGQRQRVAIARALVNDPEIIFADEPTGSLDTKTTEMIMNIFLELNKKGKTIIIVTHNMQIAQITNKCFTIKDGIICKA